VVREDEGEAKSSGKIAFVPFIGIGARRYLDLFSYQLTMGKRLNMGPSAGGVRHVTLHDRFRDFVTDPSRGHAEQKHNGIGNPDLCGKQLEEAKGNQVRTGWRELEEILVDMFSVKHPLSVHPEVDLISSRNEMFGRANGLT
jgi:hypothetical protein